jgi:hypothetical protein
MRVSSFLSFLTAIFLVSTSSAAVAQEGFLSGMERRALVTEAAQPHWATPLITTTPVLDQSLRADFQHGTEAKNATLWNLFASKGVKVIVAPRLEVDANFTPYLIHSNGVHNGFGDASWTVKYRLLGLDEHHGDALLTAWVSGTYPTGSYTNGAANATVTPTVGGGKGWGRFDVLSTLGATLPVAGTATAGRSIAWNTVGQAKLSPHWYVEVEDNASYGKGGTKDGQTTNYLTPGLISRWRNDKRRGFTLGAGMEFATSRTHTLDHNLVLSSRVHF